MIVASCPACRESVTVPTDARSSAIVQCPWCHAQCRLEQFLSQLPPPLIVVAADETGEGNRRAAVDTGEVFASETPIPPFDFTPGSAGEASIDVRGPARRTVRRPAHVPWEVAKIVGGALLAVPAAQLILWWLVPYDWKRDLLGVGPSVSRVVPWAVPAKFRDSDWNDPDGQRVAVGEHGALDDLPSDRVWPPPHRTAPDGPAPEKNAAPHTGNQAQDEADRGYTTADLREAVERALQASVAWDTSPDRTATHRVQLTDEFYTAFAYLGKVLAFLQPGDPQARELVAALRDLLTSLGHQPDKLVMLGNQSSEWLDRPTRPHDGVFLFGTVKDIRQEGPWFVTDLELAAMNRRTQSIVSSIDPQPFYIRGDRILMLGALIAAPQDNLPGYTGTAPTAVLGSFPVRLPR